MDVAIVGAGNMATRHALLYREMGHSVVAFVSKNDERARLLATISGAEQTRSLYEVLERFRIDFLDVCTPPASRAEIVATASAYCQPVLLEKPMAKDVVTCNRMLTIAEQAHIPIGVISQTRFAPGVRKVKEALRAEALGELIQVDAYVKLFRRADYFADGRATWLRDGGGALMTQGIHSVDLLRWLCGPFASVSAHWQHSKRAGVDTEDVLNALIHFRSGATGVLQVATNIRPGMPSRLEIHGTLGSVVVEDGAITRWDAPPFECSPSLRLPPLALSSEMAKHTNLAQQLNAFAKAVREHYAPEVTGHDGREAVRFVEAAYQACRTGMRMLIRDV